MTRSCASPVRPRTVTACPTRATTSPTADESELVSHHINIIHRNDDDDAQSRRNALFLLTYLLKKKTVHLFIR
jgi:hypothetical protein